MEKRSLLMVVEMLESIEHLEKQLNIQANTMEKQRVLIRGCWRKYCESIEHLENK